MLEVWNWGANACDAKWRIVEGVYFLFYVPAMRSQVAADGGCERDVIHRMNEDDRSWGMLKRVLSNRGLGIKAKKCKYQK